MRRDLLAVTGLILAGAVGTVYASGAQVLYVDADATGPSHDGSSWCLAYTELFEALAVAKPGTTIRVAGGTYRPDTASVADPRQATFSMLSGVRLEGGYAGCGAADPDARDIAGYETTLSGDLKGNDTPVSCTQDSPDCDDPLGRRCMDGFCIIAANNAENALHVVTASGVDETAVLDGFTITGGRADDSSHSACGGGMFIDMGANPTIVSCTFRGNWGEFGSGICNDDGDPTLTNCSFRGNSGGGMYNNRGSPTLTNCSFSGNSDGGMFNYRGSPTLTNCTFIGNSAILGGGMYNSQGTPTLTNCTFRGNVATFISLTDSGADTLTLADHPFSDNSPRWVASGGGIYINSGHLTLTDCTFSSNWAGSQGGGMCNAWGSATLTNCAFVTNSASSGGGIYTHYNSSGPVELTECIFIENTAGGGGGIYHGSGKPTLTNCTFRGNMACRDGARGGGMISGSDGATLVNCTFEGNSASGDDASGGGMYNAYGNLTLTSCIFRGNSASGKNARGGGIGMYSDYPPPTVVNCTFEGNSASGDHASGGGMYNQMGSPTLANCIFRGNSASGEDARGGGIGMYSDYPPPTVVNCTFDGNSASSLGGGMYNDGPGVWTVANSILWGNTRADGVRDQWAQISSMDGVSYSCIEGWEGAGAGNIGDDPLFVPGPGGCYYLSQVAAGEAVNSPCVDAGSDTAANLGLDTLTTRTDEAVDTGIVDMAYHYPVTGLPLVMGDFDRDGDVDLADFANLQGCFTGIGPESVIPCCRIFDDEPDWDLDLADFGSFADALTGPR